jgi:hypothetical protein
MKTVQARQGHLPETKQYDILIIMKALQASMIWTHICCLPYGESPIWPVLYGITALETDTQIILQAEATSLSVTRRINLVMAISQVAPLPLSLAPVIWSISNSLPDHRVAWAAHGGK